MIPIRVIMMSMMIMALMRNIREIGVMGIIGLLEIIIIINMALEEDLIHIITSIPEQSKSLIQEILISISQIIMKSSIRIIWMLKEIMMIISMEETNMPQIIILNLLRLKRNPEVFLDLIHFQVIKTKMMIF